MNARDLILLDLRETRRRFLMVANSFPDHLLHWRPDPDALSVGGHIRHVLLHDLDWLYIFEKGRLPTKEEQEPLWEKPPFTTVKAEIERAEPFHQQFIDYVGSLASEDFSRKMIRWPHRPIERLLGDTLERKAYHDAVHTGQLLQYLRMLQLPRPGIWD